MIKSFITQLTSSNRNSTVTAGSRLQCGGFGVLIQASTNFFSFAKRQAVAQWLRCCATDRKVAGSIPAGPVDFSLT